MSESLYSVSNALIRQQDIQKRCVHPSGEVVEFSCEEINSSIPERFEHQVD
jgi:uncharacterized protein with PIN domain